MVANENRRELPRTAQAAIAQGLQNIGVTRQADTQQAASTFPQTCFQHSLVMSCLSILP
jgi:hypothetical protein